MRGSRVTPGRRVPATSKFSATASGFPGLVPVSAEPTPTTQATRQPPPDATAEFSNALTDVTAAATDTSTQREGTEENRFASSASDSSQSRASPLPGPEEGRRGSTEEGQEEQKVRGDPHVPLQPMASTSADAESPAEAETSTQVTPKRTAGAMSATTNVRTRPRNTISLASGKADANASAQAAATRRKLQTGFGQILPAFQQDSPAAGSNVRRAALKAATDKEPPPSDDPAQAKREPQRKRDSVRSLPSLFHSTREIY